ncbi:MAG: hypothetical protein V3V08_08600 [Nannocystaceae bacterium]
MDFIPYDARLAVRVAWLDPGLEAALRLLGAWHAHRSPALPIFAATEFENLGFDMFGLRGHLERAGLHPAELVKLHGPGGDTLWWTPTRCDEASLRPRLSDTWQVTFRASPRGWIGTASDAAIFPFDILLPRNGAIVLAPRGRAGRIQAWLGKHRPLGATASGPGERLAQLRPAPLRAAFRSDGLLTATSTADPSTASAPPSERASTLRIGRDGLEFNGRLVL